MSDPTCTFESPFGRLVVSPVTAFERPCGRNVVAILAFNCEIPTLDFACAAYNVIYRLYYECSTSVVAVVLWY